MTTYTLTVSTDDLGLGVIDGARVVVERKRTQVTDIFNGRSIGTNSTATNSSGIATILLEPDDGSVYHELKIFDLAGILVYSKIFIMPPQAVAITALPVQDIITASAAQAVAASVTATAQAVISTEQAIIATEKAVLTAADKVQTGLDVVATAADRIQTGQDVIDADLAKDAAQLSETNASNSAAIAAASGRIYVDATAGLAATTNGQYFYVPQSSPASIFYDLYKNNAGSALFVNSAPSKTLIDTLIAKLTSDVPFGSKFAIYGDDGTAAVLIKNDGTFVAYAIEFTTLNDMTAQAVYDSVNNVLPITYSDGNQLVGETITGFICYVLDDAGFIALGLQADGTVVANALTLTTLNGVAVEDIISGSSAATADYRGTYDAEVNHLLGYGQSLSIGATTTAISTTANYDSLRFVGGVRPTDAGGTSASQHASLVALVETSVAGLGETPMTGMAESIKKRILADNGIVYTSQNYQLLASASGQGGQDIYSLRKGGSYYSRLTDDMTYGYSLSQAASKTYKIKAFVFTQGESDYFYSTSKSAYKTLAIQLLLDVDTDAKAITSQTNDVVMITYQLSSHSRYQYVSGVASAASCSIALAQLELSNEQPNIYVACPTYHFSYTDDVHLDAVSARLMGEYYGLAYKKVVIDGEDFLPLQPISSQKQGAICLVKFHVPVLPLAIDTTQVAAVSNYGFTLWQSDGTTPITISSVSISQPDTVKIVAATTIPTGAILRYAFYATTNGTTGKTTGPRGNLRDSQGDTVTTSVASITYRLDNFCVIFERTL